MALLAQNAAGLNASPAVKEVRLKDYKPPVFFVKTVELDFEIFEEATKVRSRLAMYRNEASKEKRGDLVLFGENQKLIAVKVDGRLLEPQDYVLTEHSLTLKAIGAKAIVEIESENVPQANTALSGLYAAGPMLCTQCESEGFRRITYFPDRPDVLAKFTVTIHADVKKYPVLLSNGNLIAKGKEKNGRHFVKWQDPFAKPCYLFALVAGKLDRKTTHFVTASGRKVLIEIYTEPGRIDETGFALKAIKDSMKWDEETFGLEYDLDRFMIVATSFFNMGAMENKGLNIFNDACVLGRADTATDDTIAFIERVVGHEYFHNYTGNRVTCRDWFQLSLKEGLTVYRDHEFCGDMNGRDVERLDNVSTLRRAQFSEDAGAMAHPVRPASYQAIDNFYTATVYEKGAEVVRMIQTLVGRNNFRKGVRRYLKKHDGQAATCEDFVRAHEEISKIDLSQFMLWYAQAGTPVLDIVGKYEADKKRYSLKVKQSCPPTPGQPHKKPMHMPFAVGLLDQKGRDLIGTKLLQLKKANETFVFENVAQKPVPSLLRQFSAPVRLNFAYTDEELLFLMANDTDAFNKWEAAQKLYMKLLLSNAMPGSEFVAALGAVLKDAKLEGETRAMTLALPSEQEVGLALKASGQLIDPVKLYLRRREIVTTLSTGLQNELWQTYRSISKTLKDTATDGKARGMRSLKNTCLGWLMRADSKAVLPLASQLVEKTKNMTDQITGLNILAEHSSPQSEKMLALFEKRYRKNPNIMDHWLSAQASARREDVLATVKKLVQHPAFDMNNPNRVSALLGYFAGNPLGFHATNGSGYKYIASLIPDLDKVNPQAAARLAKPFLRWRDYDEKRQSLMKSNLDSLAKKTKLSKNIREVIEKSLAG